MSRVQGKTALITGAAMGMGEAHAKLLAKEGASVIVTDIADDQGKAVADVSSPTVMYQNLIQFQEPAVASRGPDAGGRDCIA